MLLTIKADSTIEKNCLTTIKCYSHSSFGFNIGVYYFGLSVYFWIIHNQPVFSMPVQLHNHVHPVEQIRNVSLQ